MFKMEMKELQARTYTLEPGDNTHYEFMLAMDGSKIIVTSIGGAFFKGQKLSASSIAKFMCNKPALLCVPDGEYCRYVESTGMFQDPFIKYIQEKTKCMEYTALAAILCCYYFLLDEFKKAGVVDQVREVTQNG